MLHLLVAVFLGKEPDTKDQFVETLPTLKDKVQKVDPNVMFSAINDLAKVWMPAFLVSFVTFGLSFGFWLIFCLTYSFVQA